MQKNKRLFSLALVSMTGASLHLFGFFLPADAQAGSAPPGSFVQSTNQSQQNASSSTSQFQSNPYPTGQYQTGQNQGNEQNAMPVNGQSFIPQNGQYLQQTPPVNSANQGQFSQNYQQPPVFQQQQSLQQQSQQQQPQQPQNFQPQPYQSNNGFQPYQSQNGSQPMAPVTGAVQENQYSQTTQQAQNAATDPSWPTDFSDKTAATQPAAAQITPQDAAPAQPSKVAAVGSALVKTIGTVMAARAANSMMGGYGSPYGGYNGGGGMMYSLINRMVNH